jgi:hypothetical protein
MREEAQSSDVKWIAIIGNLISAGSLERNSHARQTALWLGKALAEAGYGIVVYSNDANFLEGPVVEGYVGSGAARNKSILMKYPANKANMDFPERKRQENLFQDRSDTSTSWETSYYDSLKDVQGLLLLGGGRSTLIAGLVGLGYGRAVVPIASFNGEAKKVLDKISRMDGVLTESEDSLLRATTWDEASARKAVAIFQQYEERMKQRNIASRLAVESADRTTKRSAFGSVSLLVLTCALILVVLIRSDLVSALLGPILMISAIAAGISGATLRMLWDLFVNRVQSGQPAYARVVLGLAAGLLSALLIAVPQIMAEPHPPKGVTFTPDQREEMQSERFKTAIPTSVFGALIAGFAADQFYRKLLELKLKESLE